MSEIMFKVKELLTNNMGLALGEKEQKELYKQLQKLVSGSQYKDKFKTVYKACCMCELNTEYHKSNFEDWKILIIFNSEDTRREGLVSLAKREHENKINYIPVLQMKILDQQKILEKLEYSMKSLKSSIEQEKEFFEEIEK